MIETVTLYSYSAPGLNKTFIFVQFVIYLKKSVLLFFFFNTDNRLNDRQNKKIEYFQGESENFIQGNKIQQGKGNTYNMYYCIWNNGSCRDSDSNRCNKIISDKSVYNDGCQLLHNNLKGDEYPDWQQQDTGQRIFQGYLTGKLRNLKTGLLNLPWVSISFNASGSGNC